MRPQFNYLDKSEKRAKDEAKAPGEGKKEPANVLTYKFIHVDECKIFRARQTDEKNSSLFCLLKQIAMRKRRMLRQ